MGGSPPNTTTPCRSHKREKVLPTSSQGCPVLLCLLSKQDLQDTERSCCPVELWVAPEMPGLRFSEGEPLESHPRNIEGFVFSNTDLLPTKRFNKVRKETESTLEIGAKVSIRKRTELKTGFMSLSRGQSWEPRGKLSETEGPGLTWLCSEGGKVQGQCSQSCSDVTPTPNQKDEIPHTLYLQIRNT